MTTLKSTTVPKAEKKAAISGSVACAAAGGQRNPIQRESGLRRLGATKMAGPPPALAPPRARTRLAGQAADEGPAVGGDACGARAVRPRWATALRRADVHGAPVHVQLAARLDGRGGGLVSKGDEGVAFRAPGARVRDKLRRSKSAQVSATRASCRANRRCTTPRAAAVQRCAAADEAGA